MATHPSFFHLVCFRDGKDSELLRNGSICVPGHSTIITRSTKTVSGWYCNEDFCSPRNMLGRWYQASIASINPKEDMVTIVLRVDWYDFISFFPAGLSFYNHVIEVVECLNTGWIATNYLVDDLEMVLSCLTHIHRVSPHVANWQQSAWPQPQQPPPLATGDDMVHVLKALSELEVKMMSMDVYSPANNWRYHPWPSTMTCRHYYCTIPGP